MEKYFRAFKKYAFRLELLQEYYIIEEKESFELFLKKGEIIQDSASKEWTSIIENAKKRGAKMQRVHIIKFPLSDYLKYEIEYYKINMKAGEDICFVLDKEYQKIKNKINHDFWLFDDKIALKINYDTKGKYLGFEEIKKETSKYINLKNKLLSIVTPIGKLQNEIIKENC